MVCQGAIRIAHPQIASNAKTFLSLGDAKTLMLHKNIGNGPNTVSESTVSNTELSEFFGAH